MTDTVSPETIAARQKMLFERLEALGIATETHIHAPVFTVEESRELRGDLPGAHCKSLFLKDKKSVLWLVVALEDRRIDLKALAGLMARPGSPSPAPQGLPPISAWCRARSPRSP